jgi:hypothetical protein
MIIVPASGSNFVSKSLEFDGISLFYNIPIVSSFHLVKYKQSLRTTCHITQDPTMELLVLEDVPIVVEMHSGHKCLDMFTFETF